MSVFEIYPHLFIIFSGILGLVIGSFLNVVIYRLPLILEQQWTQYHSQIQDSKKQRYEDNKAQKLSLSLPRSHCPQCKQLITAKDNIPLLSWILLKGKCRHCKAAIPIRYPLIELFTALLSVFVSYYLGYSLYTCSILAVSYVLIALAMIDFDHLILPDQLTIPLVWAGVIIALLEVGPISISSSIWGAVTGYLSLWSIYWLFKLFTGKEGMGYGDFKLFAAAGAWLGWQYLPVTALLAAVFGLIGGIINLKQQNQNLNQAFPFGPYIAISFWIMLIWGESITRTYFNFVFG